MAALPPYVQALLLPGTYPHPASNIRLVETHVSWVVLAGAYAYKVKKPVDLGFLDFSTVTRRAAICREEVRLNRRLCRDVYLGVVWIAATDGRYRMQPAAAGESAAHPLPCAASPLLEPAVRMRRLPDGGMLTHLLSTGTADTRLMARLAHRLARFHAAAPTGPGVDEHGDPAAVRANWQENFQQTAPFVARVVPPEQWHAIRRFVDRFLGQHESALRRRVAEGRIREGHGDLHAGSICVEGHRLQLFDCIEFNRRFRCGDVAAEVAFLAMDLDHHARADLGDAFVAEYERASGDGGVRDLLSFYMCYCAYVRGKVLCFRSAEAGISPPEAAEAVERARAYFDLAATYARWPVSPLVVQVTGLPASGKTTVARAVAARLAFIHLSSDVIRKRVIGLAQTNRRREPFGRALYSAAATRRVYSALRRQAARWLRGGRSVVLDATYGSPHERAAVRRLAARLGLPLVVLVCQADETTLGARLTARSQDATAVSDARLDLWPRSRAAYIPPRHAAPPGCVTLTLDTTGPLGTTIRPALTAILDAAAAASAA